MKKIKISSKNNLEVLVDDEDFEYLSQFNWQLSGEYVSRTVYLHKEVLNNSEAIVDHIDRNKLNCQKSNLRVATRSENNQNRGPNHNKSSCKSKYRGVYWRNNRNTWIAQQQVDGRKHHIGSFRTEEEANQAAKAWRKINMPYAMEWEEIEDA